MSAARTPAHLRYDEALSESAAVRRYVAAARVRPRLFLPCAQAHPGFSCAAFAALRYPRGMLLAAKLYAPLHALGLLLGQRRALAERPLRTLLGAAWGLAKSVVFLSSLSVVFNIGVCRARNWRSSDDGVNPLVAGTLAGGTLAIESVERRREITLYVVPRFLEVVYRWLRNRRLVAPLPHGDLALFAGVWTLLMAYFVHKPRLIKRTYRTLLQLAMPTVSLAATAAVGK